MIMNGNHNQSFSDVCSDLFSLILYLRESGDVEQTDVLYKRFVKLFSSIEEEARKLDIPDVDIEDAEYALVALIDETMRWASRLEQEFFRRNIAGEEFFQKLDQIKESKGRTDVLRIYYLCLVLGFEGKYFRTPDRLEAYIEELGQILGLQDMKKISPHGEASEKVVQSRRSGIPAWVPWVFSAAGVVAVCVIFIVLRIRIGGWTTAVIRRIQGIVG